MDGNDVGLKGFVCNDLTFADIDKELSQPTDKRIFAIAGLTWKAALRFKLFLVISALLVLAVVVRPRLAANNLAAILSATRQGLGLARLPDYLFRADCAAGRLVRLLPGWSTGTRKVSLVWPEARQMVVVQRAFLEFVSLRLGKT